MPLGLPTPPLTLPLLAGSSIGLGLLLVLALSQMLVHLEKVVALPVAVLCLSLVAAGLAVMCVVVVVGPSPPFVEWRAIPA